MHGCIAVLTGAWRAPHLGDALPFMSIPASCSIACASLTLPGSPLPAAATSQCTLVASAYLEVSALQQERSIPWPPRVHRRAWPKRCGLELAQRRTWVATAEDEAAQAPLRI